MSGILKMLFNFSLLNNKKNLAPIVLFVYNRPKHLKETIRALQLNKLANFSDLFIYSDGPKNNNDEGVFKVREYLKTINGFRSIKIIERDKNIGLASSIINGVTKIVNKYGKVIVLEDDMITSPFFLEFINNSLNYFKNKKSIWHIAGWNYPVLFGNSNEVIVWRMMHCWGWATWQDRWKYFEKNPSKLIKTFSREDIHKFNLDGFENFWQQILDNQNGQIDTWAIFWYAIIFEHGGLCLNPGLALTKNVGLDGSGTNCAVQSDDLFDLQGKLLQKTDIIYPNDILENNFAVEQVKKFLKYNRIVMKNNNV